MIELPLAILLWFAVLFVLLAALLGVVAVLADGISKYKRHKAQLLWDHERRKGR